MALLWSHLPTYLKISLRLEWEYMEMKGGEEYPNYNI